MTLIAQAFKLYTTIPEKHHYLRGSEKTIDNEKAPKGILRAAAIQQCTGAYGLLNYEINHLTIKLHKKTSVPYVATGLMALTTHI